MPGIKEMMEKNKSLLRGQKRVLDLKTKLYLKKKQRYQPPQNLLKELLKCRDKKI